MSIREATVSNLKQRWILTEFGQGSQQRRAIDLPMRELIVGRSPEVDIVLNANGISKRHARLSCVRDELVVEDLGSTNGTYVNGQRVQQSVVVVGDLLQFANSLYKVGRHSDTQHDGTMEEGILPWAQTLLLFDQLLTERAVVPNFQPIVELADQKVVGYELLARSDLDGLTNPGLMFAAAERLGQQELLSEILRHEGLRKAGESTQRDKEIFLNTHPTEVVTERFVNSLRDLRAVFPTAKITIEIHEAAITEPAMMKSLHTLLREFDMRLSYDDFGAGQGRLLELADVPPHVLKFDMQLIRDIDRAPASRQELLKSLVQIAKNAGAQTLAEGVETEAEHGTCWEMGFELGQGYLYGRPHRELLDSTKLFGQPS
ncbi:MAG: EAL domain-containing protein [Planctomycetaceae bacterium]|nr:EAL domain-containing protein [Planctomycetaceae bacterium]